MDYRFLGKTGLLISALSLGTMTFGGRGSPFFEGVGSIEKSDAKRAVDAAIDAGVNLFDTADVYSRGLSEEMLGNAVAGKRDKVLLATKCHGRMSDEVNDRGQSRHHIIEACESSLRRLKVDHIDLYQVHGFDAYVDLEESLGALTDLVTQGKIRYIGCSNLSGWHVMKALAVSERKKLRKFVSYQGNYSLVAREAEHEIFPLCEDQNLGFLVWSPLAGGYLTGKYQDGSANALGRRGAVGDPGTIDEATASSVLATMSDIAEDRSVSLAQVALNYASAKRGVTSVLIGARSVEQLEDNLGCLSWALTEDEIAALNRVSARPLPYPYWHQQQYNAARYRRSG